MLIMLPGRFTLDSAAEFLLGSNVHSLDAPLPYAHNSAHRETVALSHSSDRFAEAFIQAQQQIALRIRLGFMWPLLEFWKDKTEDAMEEINSFLNPALKDALAKKNKGEMKSSIAEGNYSTTLLDHLVAQTAGE